MSRSQIFREPVPKEKLIEFLDQCVEVKNNSYVFSKTAFKTAQYKDIINSFCKELEKYYYESKKYYATRSMTYKNLVTIIRQICKYHFIPFTSNIKYYKSVYEISYTIFMTSEQ